MLFWLILKAYRSKTSESFDSASINGLFNEEDNVVDLSAYRRADVGALRLLQEYSFIETSNLSEKDKLREILLWNQKLESFEKDNRKIIQSKGFLRPVKAKTNSSSIAPLSKI